MAERLEVAYAAMEPYIDATRDVFAEYEPEPGVDLSAVRKTKVLVEDWPRESHRNYAACRDDGLLIVVAPEAAAELPVEQLQAILCHEFGHAVDFLFPGRFVARRRGPAVWVPEGSRKMAKVRRLWAERDDDQVEWSADSIAETVIGRPITYCGPCQLQCFEGTQRRPEGLR